MGTSVKLIGRKLRQFGILNGILAVSITVPLLQAETRLTAASSTSSSLVIRLENDRPIAGLQFVLRSSSNIALMAIHKSGRTSAENWIVASNLMNDSTLSVVIVCSDLSYFSNGKGVVAEVSFSMRNNASAAETVSFTGVLGADPQAQLVNVTTCDFVLNSQTESFKNPSSDFSIGQNYPNPFNPSTRISYELRNDAQVKLAIFDIAGREISRLVDQYQPKGTYAATWNSSENRWGQVASGTYFARLQVGDKVATRKMLLTK
jgi:hypothetical protein